MRMEEIEQDIQKDLEELEDDISQYSYLIACGKELILLPEEQRTDDCKIKECQVNTWMRFSCEDGRMYLRAFSEALVVSGVLALLQEIYEKRTPDEVRAYRCGLLECENIKKHLNFDQLRGLQIILEKLRGEDSGTGLR